MYEGKEEAATSKIRVGDIFFALTIIIATVINFTDFSFSFDGISKLTATSILVYMVSMTTYKNFFHRGKLEGKLDPDYIAAAKEFDSESEAIISEGNVNLISEFIEYYVEQELIDYRKSILFRHGIDYELYREKYLKAKLFDILKDDSISVAARFDVIKCNGTKPMSLNNAQFLSSAKSGKRGNPLGQSGRRMERIDTASQALKRIVTSVFSGAVGIDIVFNFSLKSVITWAFRMLPIVTAIVSGQMRGYKNITETELAYKRNQIYLIKQFREWAKTKEK